VGSGRAEAASGSGAWVSSASLTPTEQRVAVAVGPARTTVWTSLRFDAAGGTVAIVVPAPPGTSLDLSSDAWFEALEVATAPRVFPPAGLSPFCPGKSGSANVFEIDGQVGHTASLPLEEIEVLADVAAVSSWAAQANLVIPSKVVEALAALTGVSFVAVRFVAPPGAGVTPTLRVAMVGAPPMLPLALTQAGGSDLQVTAWMIGPGQADAIGAVQVAIAPSALAWKAGPQTSNYDDLRSSALSSGPDTFLVEAASHTALGDNVPIAQGSAFLDGVVTTFFERAAAYGDGAFDSAQCIATATPLLASSAPVAAVCPHAALGVVAPTPACVEAPGSGQIDPGSLRCGPGADDLALALSGLTPSATWVTRQSMRIPAGSSGVDAFLGFAYGAAQSSVLVATSLDTSGCGDGGTSTGSGSGSSSASGVAAGSSGGMMSSGNGSGEVINDGFAVAGDIVDALDSADDSAGCSCSGTEPTSTDATTSTSTSTSGACSGSSDPSSGTDGSSDSSGSCSSGSSSSDGSSSCSSGSSSGSDSCSSGSSSSDSCSGSSGGSSAFDCSAAGPRRVRLPKLSILLMLALAVAAPLRRRGRRSRARRCPR